MSSHAGERRHCSESIVLLLVEGLKHCNVHLSKHLRGYRVQLDLDKSLTRMKGRQARPSVHAQGDRGLPRPHPRPRPLLCPPNRARVFGRHSDATRAGDSELELSLAVADDHAPRSALDLSDNLLPPEQTLLEVPQRLHSCESDHLVNDGQLEVELVGRAVRVERGVKVGARQTGRELLETENAVVRARRGIGARRARAGEAWRDM